MTVSSALASSSEAQRVTEVLGWTDGGPARSAQLVGAAT